MTNSWLNICVVTYRSIGQYLAKIWSKVCMVVFWLIEYDLAQSHPIYKATKTPLASQNTLFLTQQCQYAYPWREGQAGLVYPEMVGNQLDVE